MKRALVIVLALSALVALGLFVYVEKPWVEPDQRVVRIMDPIEANNLHVPVADRMGFFAEEGLKVDVSHTSAGKLAMDAVNAGGVDYGVVVDMNVAHTLFATDDVVILTEIAEPIKAIKILGRRDHGVVVPGDLVGKKIGVLFGVNIHLFILKYLEEHGIDKTSVNLVNLKPADAVAAFRAGDIDAVITWQPHAYRLSSELGDRVVVLTDDDGKYWTYKMLVVAKRSHVESNPKEALQVLQALVRADDFIQANPSQAQGILAQTLNLSADDVKQFWDEIHFEVRISPQLLSMLKTEVDWLQKDFLNGKTPVTTDLRSVIGNMLAKVKPSAFKPEAH